MPMWGSRDGRPPNFLELFAFTITGWQNVEVNLLLIYGYFINSRNGPAMAASFNAVVNFQTRLSMTDAAAQIACEGSPLLVEWDLLHKRLREQSRKRNHLAHFMLMPKNLSDDNTEMVLRSNVFDVRNHSSNEYDFAKLAQTNTSFIRLKTDMDSYLEKLGDWRRQPSRRKSQRRSDQ
jgi:hypothetical protein